MKFLKNLKFALIFAVGAYCSTAVSREEDVLASLNLPKIIENAQTLASQITLTGDMNKDIATVEGVISANLQKLPENLFGVNITALKAGDVDLGVLKPDLKKIKTKLNLAILALKNPALLTIAFDTMILPELEGSVGSLPFGGQLIQALKSGVELLKQHPEVAQQIAQLLGKANTLIDQLPKTIDPAAAKAKLASFAQQFEAQYKTALDTIKGFIEANKEQFFNLIQQIQGIKLDASLIDHIKAALPLAS